MGKLIKNSKLSDYQIRKIIDCFVLELTAVQASKHLGINRKTVDRIYGIIREKIAHYQEVNQDIFYGEIEMDESYFGGKRKYDRGRSTKSKFQFLAYLSKMAKYIPKSSLMCLNAL